MKSINKFVLLLSVANVFAMPLPFCMAAETVIENKVPATRKVENIIVDGNTKTKTDTILREMIIKKGQPFDAKMLQYSISRLKGTGFFGDVEARLYEGQENPHDIIIGILVDEQKTGTVSLGAGYSASNGLVGIIGYDEINLWGRGDQFSVNWEVGGKTGSKSNYTVSYTRPWINKHGDSIGASVFDHEYDYEDYNYDGDTVAEYYKRTKGFNVTYGFARDYFIKDYVTLETRTSDYTEYQGGYNYDRYPQYLNDNFGRTNSLSWVHAFDNRDNQIDPEQGKKITLTGIMAGHFLGGDFSYYKLIAESRNYYKVGHAQVIATRLMGGIGSGDIPYSDLFALGGATTLRGYKDDNFHGNRFYAGAVEYRYPIAKKIEGVIFTDGGSAWGGTDNLFWYEDSKKFHYAVGLGFRVKTPIGPIRIDYGKSPDRGRFHLSFGGKF